MEIQDVLVVLFLEGLLGLLGFWTGRRCRILGIGKAGFSGIALGAALVGVIAAVLAAVLAVKGVVVLLLVYLGVWLYLVGLFLGGVLLKGGSTK